MMSVSKIVALSALSLSLGLPVSAKDLPPSNAIDFSHAVLKEAGITSAFGMRTDPFRNRPAWHSGIDLGAEWDAPISAPAAGTVIAAATTAGYGLLVDLELADGWVMRFSQMKKIDVELGDVITAGTQIGLVGSSGRSTGPHLHLEVLHDGKQYDPQDMEGLELFAEERAIGR